jgi:hypothetical protein
LAVGSIAVIRRFRPQPGRDRLDFDMNGWDNQSR